MSRTTRVALCSCLLLVSGMFSPSARAQEPEVQGRKYSEWLKMLESDPSVRHRRGAVIAMGIIGTRNPELMPRVLNPLGKALLNDKELAVRQQVITVLNGIKPEHLRLVVPQLADALRTDKEAVVRSGVANLLGRLDERAKPALSALVAAFKDADPATRAAAVETVGRIGTDAREHVSDLVVLFKDPEPSVRSAAVFAAARLGPEAGDSASAALGTVLTEDKDGDVRREAAKAITLLGPVAKSAVPALAKVLASDPSAEVRQQAALALGRMGGEVRPAVGVMKVALKKDKDKTVRLFVVRAFGNSLGRAVKEVLADLGECVRSDPSGEVRLAAIQEIAVLGPDAAEALPALRAATRDVQLTVRSAANNAITKIQAKPKQ